MARYKRAMRTLLLLPFLVALAGCSASAATYKAPAETYGSIAIKRDAPAKGTRSCSVHQYSSAHLARLRDAEKARLGISVQTTVSDLIAMVSRDGSVNLGLAEDTYPGTTQYFRVGGKRYSGPEDGWVSVPKQAMLDEGVVQYTYTSWPYGSEISGEDVLGGFAKAYSDCLAFLNA